MQLMPRGGDWTVEDLEHLPEGDGLQYELLDGILFVSPAPVKVHQRAVVRMLGLLTEACPAAEAEVFVAPFDWQPDPRTSLQPDVLVVRDEDTDDRRATGPLVLAVEVLSPTTRRKDLLLKRDKYQEAGVESYWVVDPYEPSVLVLELREGVYYETGKAAGDEELELSVPFAITIVPSALVTR
ncbi:Uma2 family endonuclease [Kineosporia babensis]|uniref:Uma2 family endonuclease n=1 Tax=Kineosporia babensis TaxID=499548 RepID=A0A9X1NGP0_9ACTN|nr:Uma2 family endonuclease [Kineosporia babensis]MCD5313471.1 Uma2 family endonuclease [Kineosporia babensis]